jgi:hypothetical protein
MNRIRACAHAVSAAVLAASLVGCSEGRYVPVSGIVTHDRKPYRNALVMFQPIATNERPAPGRASSGSTDADGRFHLKTFEGQDGAVVGKHRIRITTRYSDKLRGYEVWDFAKNSFAKATVDPIPPQWNTESYNEFDVPAGGTDKANFDIRTPAQ